MLTKEKQYRNSSGLHSITHEIPALVSEPVATLWRVPETNQGLKNFAA